MVSNMYEEHIDLKLQFGDWIKYPSLKLDFNYMETHKMEFYSDTMLLRNSRRYGRSRFGGFPGAQSDFFEYCEAYSFSFKSFEGVITLKFVTMGSIEKGVVKCNYPYLKYQDAAFKDEFNEMCDLLAERFKEKVKSDPLILEDYYSRFSPFDRPLDNWMDRGI